MSSIDPKDWDNEDHRGGFRKKRKTNKPKKKRKGYIKQVPLRVQ